MCKRKILHQHSDIWIKRVFLSAAAWITSWLSDVYTRIDVAVKIIYTAHFNRHSNNRGCYTHSACQPYFLLMLTTKYTHFIYLIVAFQPLRRSQQLTPVFFFFWPALPPAYPFLFLLLALWSSILCLPMSLLHYDPTTHRNFRKHLRMVGSRRIKAQSESDLCVCKQLICLFNLTVILFTPPSSFFFLFLTVMLHVCENKSYSFVLLFQMYMLKISIRQAFAWLDLCACNMRSLNVFFLVVVNCKIKQTYIFLEIEKVESYIFFEIFSLSDSRKCKYTIFFLLFFWGEGGLSCASCI